MFHISLDYGDALRNKAIDFAHRHDTAGLCSVLALTTVAVIVSAVLAIRFAPEASGGGISHLKGVLSGLGPFRWVRVLLVKFISTVIGSTAGLMLGRAGPSIHMGGAIGHGLSNLWPIKGYNNHSVMVAAGGGAGLSAAFNSPLAGLVFVLEELDTRCTSREFFAAAIACLTSDTVCRLVLGQYPTFNVAIAEAPPLNQLAAFLPLGVLSALTGCLFNRTFLAAQKLTRLAFWPRLIWWLTLSATVTAIAWLNPDLLGGGQDFINDIVAGEKIFTLQAVMLFFLIRSIVTIGSSSYGAAGGLFMPVLVLGALLGFCVGGVIQQLFPQLDVDARLFAVVGMASYFTGVVLAPLTGIVLIIEMTGNYALILPLFIACFSAQIVSDWLGVTPIYDALLQNQIKRQQTVASGAA